MPKPIKITVGGSGPYDPAVGAITYSNPTLEGIDGYVFGTGYGPIPEDTYTILPEGGFSYPSGFLANQVFYFFKTGLDYAVNAVGNYTNGFNLSEVLPALKGRLSWAAGGVRQFSSFHALCTENNLKDVQPVAGISGDDFTDYKDSLEDQVIQRCLSQVFSKPEYLEQVLLHTRMENSPLQSFQNNNLFCGIRFKVAKDFGISAWIKNVTLLFDGAATFNLYLFKLGTPAPIKTISVTSVANVPTTISLTDVVMSYAKERASVFYLGYFQSDLGSVKASREQVEMFETKCFSASYCEMRKLSAVRIDQSQSSLSNLPYGLTAEVHSFRDYTQKIVRSAHLFDEVIGLSMVYYLLELIVSSTRSNERERILKGAYDAIELKHYLYGAIPAQGVSKITGLNEVISVKMEQVRKTFYPEPKAQTVSIC